MNRSLIPALLLLAGGIAGADGPHFPPRSCEVFRIEGTHPARIRLQGASNVQEWSADSRVLRIDGEEDIGLKHLARLAENGALPQPEGGRPAATGIQFSLPIDTLEASNRRMLRDLKTAVGHPDHPSIVYQLLQAKPENEDGTLWEVTGLLTVAGAEHEFSHPIRVEPRDGNGWTVTGSLELQMSWFGITPPRALMGLVRAHDGFKVEFEIHVDTVCTLLAF